MSTEQKTAADAQTGNRQELELHTEQTLQQKVNNMQRVTNKQPENNQMSRMSSDE